VRGRRKKGGSEGGINRGFWGLFVRVDEVVYKINRKSDSQNVDAGNCEGDIRQGVVSAGERKLS